MRGGNNTNRNRLLQAIFTGNEDLLRPQAARNNTRSLFFVQSPYDAGYYYLLRSNPDGRTDLGYNKEPLTLKQVNEITEREGFGGFKIVQSPVFINACIQAGIIPTPTHNLKGEPITYKTKTKH